MFRAGFATALLFFACGGCHHDRALPGPSGSSSTTPPTDAGETVVLGTDDDGKTVDLTRGNAVSFRLASHAGTGYVWVPAGLDGGDGGVLSQVGDRTTDLSSETPGAPRLDVYRFVATGPGTVTVEMDLRRPWGHEPPAKTWRVTVNVR
jgi:predicted secreted protein